MYNLYVIYDKVAEESSSPMMCRTDGLALRQFMAALSKEPGAKNDYALYRVGTYDPQTMIIDPVDIKQIIPSDRIDVEAEV